MIVLQLILLLLFILPIGSSRKCAYEYSTQPPTMLDCDPLGRVLKLTCSTGSSSDNVTWYWTQNVSEAGVSGTAILPGDTSDTYQVTFDNRSTNNRDILFTVSESTLGYYWCEISNAVNVSLRASTITPVCPPINTSQQDKCTTDHIRELHHVDTELRCAEEDSPTVISRPPLPTSCVGSPSSTTVAVATTPTPSAATMIPTVNSTMNTVITTSVLQIPTTQQSALVPVVATFGVLVVVLVVVVVAIIVLVCVVRMKKTAAMKDKEQISKNGSEVLNQQPLMELENVYYSTCDHRPNVDKQEAVPEYSVVGGSEEKNEYSVINSEYARQSRVTPMYSEVTSKPTAEPGIPIQSEYSLATSADDTEQIPSEYSLAGNVYRAPRGEQPEYEVVNVTSKQQLPPEEKESPPHPANGAENLNASTDQESQELSPLEGAMPDYAQPDLSKKKKPHSSLLNNSEYANESIPPQVEAL